MDARFRVSGLELEAFAVRQGVSHLGICRLWGSGRTELKGHFRFKGEFGSTVVS